MDLKLFRACLGLMALSLACAKARPALPRNVLLVTVDTLRADHLPAYGYARPTAPIIDRLAREGVLFERAYSVASWTLPSIVSLLTSLYPSAHDCQGDRSALAATHATLAEHLSARGYYTGAVTSHVYLSTKYGLNQGFANFDEELVHHNRKRSHEAISSPAISDKAIAFLGERGNQAQPWFLWLHYFDPHSEYLEHPPEAARMGPGNQGLYDAEIAFTDLHLGRVLAELDRLGLTEETLIVFLADHGEEFGDHGGAGHRATLYEEVLRVPLILSHPMLEARRVSQPVSTIDVLPTICELLDLPPPPSMQGQSLLPLMRGEVVQERALLAEMRNSNRKDWDALIEGKYKLLCDVSAGRMLLFDLELDPKEQRDLAEELPEVVTAMSARLRLQIEASRRLGESLGGAEQIELTPEDQTRLEQLGYGGDD